MEFSMILCLLVVLTVFCKTSSSIRCFQCFPEDTYYDENKLRCKHFNGSEQYKVECVKSTMCLKRVTTLDLGNGLTTVSVHRGCASQSLGKEQVKVDRKWEQKILIHEVYQEGCKEDHHDLDKPTKTLNCYCRGNYCNNSTFIIVNFKIIFLSLFVYLANK